MPNYSFEAFDKSDNLRRGVQLAVSRDEAIGSLLAQGLTVVRIDENGSSTAAAGSFALSRQGRSSDTRALERLLDEWARLMQIGLTIDQALTISCTSHAASPLGLLASGVRTNLREGKSLARAISATFPAQSAALASCIAAGEASGRLAEMLGSLAKRSKAARAFSSELRSALAYPAFVLVTAFALIGLLVTVVLPSIGEALSNSEAHLPWATQAMLDGAALLRHYGLFVLLLLLGFAGASPLLLKMDRFRTFAEASLLRWPVVGKILLSLELSSYIYSLSVQIQGGIGVLRAVNLCQSSLRLRVLRDRASAMEQKIAQGQRISQAAAECFDMARELPALIRIGEENGRLADVLAHAAEHYEGAARHALKLVTALLTPAVTIVTGVIVGAVVLSMMSALVGLNDLAFR